MTVTYEQTMRPWKQATIQEVHKSSKEIHVPLATGHGICKY